MTATYSGFVNGDSSIQVPPTLTTDAELSSDSGHYPIRVKGGSDANYVLQRLSGTLYVAKKQTPEITWNAPAEIVYQTPLGSTQLNATADTPGTFAYSPDVGTILDAGVHSLDRGIHSSGCVPL